MNNEQNVDGLNVIPTINKTDVISRLTFHVHNDIEEAAKWYKIPIALYSEYDVYIIPLTPYPPNSTLPALNPVLALLEQVKRHQKHRTVC
jgi:hypothetical protein